jgi:DNA-binding XRE family transcriptional regulator
VIIEIREHGFKMNDENVNLPGRFSVFSNTGKPSVVARFEDNDVWLTQKQLAERLKTSNSAVCDWEKGRTQPDLQMLVQIAALFGVTTDYLLGVCDD